MSISNDLPQYPNQPELALVAALTLISRYSCCNSPVLADAAVNQLRAVANDERFSDDLRDCAENLIGFWLQRSLGVRAAQGSEAVH